MRTTNVSGRWLLKTVTTSVIPKFAAPTAHQTGFLHSQDRTRSNRMLKMIGSRPWLTTIHPIQCVCLTQPKILVTTLTCINSNAKKSLASINAQWSLTTRKTSISLMWTQTLATLWFYPRNGQTSQSTSQQLRLTLYLVPVYLLRAATQPSKFRSPQVL